MIFYLLKAVIVALIIVGESKAFGALIQLKTCPALEKPKEPWSYSGKTNGPEFWGMTYPDCYGNRQSPVDINVDDVTLDENLPKLTLNNYDKPITKATIKNNGHSIEVTPPKDGDQRTITVEGDTYSLRQFHFHWGTNYSSGSEHAIDGTYYALEMHLVHYNDKNEIAVVGILFQETDTDNDELKKIIDELPDVKYKNMEKKLESNINLNNILPSNPISFYRYDGSLTTPGCTEGVTWSVATDLVHVGKSQMEVFRSQLFATEKKDSILPSCKLSYNYRPNQPLNKRKIFKST